MEEEGRAVFKKGRGEGKGFFSVFCPAVAAAFVPRASFFTLPGVAYWNRVALLCRAAVVLKFGGLTEVQCPRWPDLYQM